MVIYVSQQYDNNGGSYCWVSEFTLLTLEEIVAPHAVMIALILSLRCCQNKIAAGRWSNYIDQALLQNLYSSLLHTR